VEPDREPRGEPRVGRPMERVNPTVLAAIALAALVLLIIGVVVFQGRNADDDRLTGDEVTGSREDPEERCSSRRTYDLIKREIFRRAAELRGADRAAFDAISGHSTVRMEAPVVRDENRTIGSVTCNGTLTIDLPPGTAVVGGRRSLSADVLYTLQPAADSSGNVLTLSNADEIITPLATLARVGQSSEAPTDPNNQVVADPLAPVDGLPAPRSPADPSAPQSQSPAGTANPSFSCANARTRGEIAVCNDAGLAALDRRMAAQFADAVSQADPEQRAILVRTRNDFLRFRDGCPSNSCIAQTYRGRIREIEDIMAGRWEPER